MKENRFRLLALARGLSKSVFKRHSNEQLLEEMRFLYRDEEG